MISSLLHLVGLRPRVYYTLTNFRGGGCMAPLASPPIRQSTVIQHPKYKSKWKPECIDIYTQSFNVNEITTINGEIKLFVEYGSASQHEIDLMSNKITKYVINSTNPAR